MPSLRLLKFFDFDFRDGTVCKYFSSKELFLVVVGFVLTGVVGTILAALSQWINWRFQNAATRRQIEVEGATKLFEEISTLLDRRSYRVRQIIYGLRGHTREECGKRMQEYRALLFEWNDRINRNLSMVQRYFGKEMREKLEFEIFAEFRSVGHSLETEYKTDPPDRKKLQQIVERVNSLSAVIYSFDMMMLKTIEANIGKHSRLRNYNAKRKHLKLPPGDAMNDLGDRRTR